MVVESVELTGPEIAPAEQSYVNRSSRFNVVHKLFAHYIARGEDLSTKIQVTYKLNYTFFFSRHAPNLGALRFLILI